MSIKQETANAIVGEFQAGTDVQQLAEDHDLPLVKVCRALVSAGEELPELDIPDGKRAPRHVERNRQIVALRHAGFSYNALAEEFSLSAGRIGDLCREAKKDAEAAS